MESVEHLFLSCPFTVSLAYDLFYIHPPPTNISNMFNNWLNGTNKIDKSRIHIGVLDLCW
jgi:hypothetical protein